MIALTTDQLSYVLERKFLGINIGKDVQFVCTSHWDETKQQYVPNKDAQIIRWSIGPIPLPSDETIMEWWGKLEEQYNSDPERPDSVMAQFLESLDKPEARITINEEI